MTAALAGIAIHRCDLAADWREDGWLPLSPDERDRARRYVREDDRRRFVAGRHLIRTTIAPILGRTADAVAIVIDRYGRPGVTGAPSFSLTHAGDHVALAVAPCGGPSIAVGIDIEAIRDDVDPLALARQVFADAELAILHGADDRIAMFFRLWTIKEALLKAAGKGLLIDPRTLCIDARSNTPSIVYAPSYLGVRGCAVLPAPHGYAAAVAWCGQGVIAGA